MKSRKQSKKLAIAFFSVIFICFSVTYFPGNIYGENSSSTMKEVVDTAEEPAVTLLRSDLITLKVHSLTRLSISNPAVADVISADAEKLLVVGRNIGQTAFFIWDAKGKRTFMVRVVDEDMELIAKRIQALLEAADVEGVSYDTNSYEGLVVLTGILPAEKIGIYNSLVSQFEGKVLNLVEQEVIEDLVQIDVQIAELSTTLSKALGFDWTSGSNSSLTNSFAEAIPTQFDNQFERIFKIGDFTRTAAITATVNLLLSEGKGRVLSKPRLVVKNGEAASFQVGGEIPVRTTTSTSGGTTQENIEFKEYGVNLTMTPVIRKGKIDLDIAIDISDIDAGNAVGDNVAFTNRAASTKLFLEDRQTIVIAGLIKQNKSETVKKVPFLGDIPVIGMAFRSRSKPTADQETEVVISLTPTILKQKKIEDVTEAEGLAQQDNGMFNLLDDESDMEEAAELAQAEEDAMEEEMEKLVISKDAEMPEEESPSLSELLQDIDEAIPDLTQERSGSAVNEGLTEEAVSENIDISEIIAYYVQAIQKKISETISYPYEAVEKGWEGTVKLTLRILKDGTLDEISVKESSGFSVFDRDALNTAQILAPFESFPPELGLEEIIVTIPIVYSQDSASLDVVCYPPEDASMVKTSLPFVPSGKTYSQSVQEKIAKSAIYPEEAKNKGWEGTVKLDLRILRDGTLAYAAVKESSGYKIFDTCALQTAQVVAPYSVFPTETHLQALDVTVPIVYSLEEK